MAAASSPLPHLVLRCHTPLLATQLYVKGGLISHRLASLSSDCVGNQGLIIFQMIGVIIYLFILAALVMGNPALKAASA
eukprot:SAG25_NODE_705_length_5845_cov_2.226940_1_plen_79_part_00